MPFGKHKGRQVASLPTDYLAWLIDKDFCKEPLRSEILQEFERRQRRYEPEEKTESASIMSARERKLLTDIIESGYRVVSKKVHPDFGGSHDDMVALNTVVSRMRVLLG